MSALAALAAAALAAAPAPPIAAEVETLPDGVELVVLPVKAAPAAAIWVVVRAGSALDPPAASGLAHVLEHVLLGGRDGARLATDVREVGGTLNGFTGRDATRYVLTAPSDRFAPLAERFLRLLTNPQFDGASLATALGVLTAEDGFRALAVPPSLVEDALFRLDPPPSGTSMSRARLTRSDLARFYGEHYLTRNVTVVVAGDLRPGAARDLVRGAVLLPPALPAERSAPRPSTPILPLAQRARGRFTAAAFGYRFDDGDRAACAALADLAQLRLALELQVRAPAASAVEASCEDLHGIPFLLALGYTRAASEGDLPARMERIVEALATVPPTARERRALERRRARAAELLGADAEALGEAAALLAARPRLGGATPIGELAPATPQPSALAGAARRTFTRERSLRIVFSPFEG